METRGGEKRGAQGDDGSLINISDPLFSFIGIIIDLIHSGAEGC